MVKYRPEVGVHFDGTIARGYAGLGGMLPIMETIAQFLMCNILFFFFFLISSFCIRPCSAMTV